MEKERYRARLKSIALFQNCTLKCKKIFPFEKLDKNVQFNSLILIPKIFICIRAREVAFYLSTQKVVRLKQCPLSRSSSEMRERETYTK